ncbi:hypothetical protein J4421_02080 [Candidatus Woesearchaeota archaeon]|nr:hypothetical protein [Candidatus Woesearchaeota archaeon]
MKKTLYFGIMLLLTALIVGCTDQFIEPPVGREPIDQPPTPPIELPIAPIEVFLEYLMENILREGFIGKKIVTIGTITGLCLDSYPPECNFILKSGKDERISIELRNVNKNDIKPNLSYRVEGFVNTEGCENVGPTELCAPFYYISVISISPILG